MKKSILFLISSSCFLYVKAQFTIQPVLPLAGIIQKSNLWNVAVINTSTTTIDCRLELILRNRINGLEVLTATTANIQVQAGAKQLNVSQLQPIQYNNVVNNINVRTDDLLPIGDYTACYRLTGDKNILAEECISFDIEPLSPPTLITPVDASQLINNPTQLTWLPPSPFNLFNKLSYEINIVELLVGQKPAEAIQQNIPFYSASNIPTNQFSLMGLGLPFEKGKMYAWQVQARDDYNYAGKSEIWTFSLDTNEITNMIVNVIPFVKLKNFNPDKTIVPNGILKFSYINETDEKQINMIIRNLSNHKEKMKSFKIGLQPGENLITLNVLKKLDLEYENLYQLELVNNRKENWKIIFEIKKY